MRPTLLVGSLALVAACESIEPCPRPAMVKQYMAFFDFGSTKVTENAMITVRQVAAAAAPDSLIGITTHTDRVGEPIANLTLSYRRGEALRAALVAAGVEPGRVSIYAQGDQMPMVRTAAGVREPQNRRAEFVIATVREQTPAGWKREEYLCTETRWRFVPSK